LQHSRFSYHGCLTSSSCLITGKWELKITDYGLNKVYRSQVDPSVQSFIYKYLHREEPLPESNIFLTCVKNLLWMAPETVTTTPYGVYTISPTKRADIYR
jgi:serine/threonine protein kinase